MHKPVIFGYQHIFMEIKGSYKYIRVDMVRMGVANLVTEL